MRTWNSLRYCPEFVAVVEVMGPPQKTHFMSVVLGTGVEDVQSPVPGSMEGSRS